MGNSGKITWLFKDLFYRAVRYSSRMLVICLCDFRTQGREHLDIHAGAMVLSTHQSLLDPVLVGICFNGRLNYIARKTLFGNSIFAFLIKALDAIEIDRERGGLAGLREMLKRLQDDKKVLLFPEGTRTTTGEIQDLKMGFVPVARRSEVPLIPVAIVGAYKILAKGERWPKRQPLAVVFGAPILPAEVKLLDDAALGKRLSLELRACKAIGDRLIAG
jgi:1-acyl-sn-glycerol-3-phosphate acyltransferase